MSRMKRSWKAGAVAVAVMCLGVALAVQSGGAQNGKPNTGVVQHGILEFLSPKRTSPLDLEIDGDILGTVRGHSKSYVTRQQLLSLPQVSYSVTNDANFSGPTKISGVAIDQLVLLLAANPQRDLAVAICSDGYETHYSHTYIAAHNPVLVLKIDGKDPAEWPKFHATGGYMGPYLISSPDFKPSFTILSHEDEPQIPFGVVRLEMQSEAAVFDAIRPHGSDSNSREVQDGYRIAQQNCFRCHNSGDKGGTKAQRPWTVLATWATASPEFFQAYIHDPKSKNPKSEMPGFPNYDAATLNALTKYFQSFTDDARSKKP
jgi:mono/diheme cytochrome c family protein